MMKIDSFKGKHRWLSNFWPAKVTLDDIEYPSVEHAYQAAKTEDHSIRGKISKLEKPYEAKRFGYRVHIRKDWEAVKYDIMYNLVYQKFLRHQELQDKLLDTGDAELIEGNTWGDTYWGVCKGVGQNNLGKILMEVRKNLAAKEWVEVRRGQTS